MSKRNIVIGDIHGCLAALERVLEMIMPASDDTIVFLGDYIDRGPDSRGVIDKVISLREQCKVVSLQGNHEIMFLSAHAGMDPRLWIQCGGAATLKSYGGSFDKVPDEHVQFMRDCIRYLETDDHIFVHASYMPNQDLAEMQEDQLFWEHLGDVLPLPHKSGKRVIVGHTPQPNFEILDAGHLVCVDTYCFGGGFLTAFDTQKNTVWQADRLGNARAPGRPPVRNPLAFRWVKRLLNKD